MNHHVGEDIRSLRKSRNLRLAELSAAVGRSVGWLSQVERGQTTPSVHDLGAIANRLGVSISFFFRSSSRAPEERGLILRAADRMAIGTPESGLTEELLSPALSGSFEMIKSTFAPRSESAAVRPAAPLGAAAADHRRHRVRSGPRRQLPVRRQVLCLAQSRR